MRLMTVVHSLFLFPPTKSSPRASQPLRNFCSSTKMIHSFDFEVFGKVQGVFFRKYTKLEADKLKIKGHVRNTDRNTVVGKAESDSKESLEQFKNFLKNVGSPSSRIDECLITNEKTLEGYSSTDFVIRR
ncbi:acylphosphatase, putative [Plasmodium vivax]|uniref:acylphosphatase n=6 Tax=Plasmodium vivax TaxID=5855 RepID=A5K4D1_PLAVS|nr:acylphosphatase, putative [Plasmodium vivax]KMZ80568.1 acylphosphatase [Plasmodium vivax India VII]KMZ84126.1 acylphosphatase [Plasmodium vivax Brazil I]KMZ93160.1 acylphosphatase [Plasmodium vivax Mauritania I]KMZ99653.1 acylphosphatase [Plasmodium vivax North Korean]EDL45509.1 acylphosphatase, putative [Plasmodium vivax]|eukprot:XP_001615236.1 acylphosphatase [Plasmodium vivax Sal-1]